MREIIKKRIINAIGITCNGCVNTIDYELTKLEGVKSAIAGVEGHVYVEYDLMKITINEIEDHLVELGYILSNSYWDRFKSGWRHFAEQNELDNMHSVHRSCCTVPESEFTQYEKIREAIGR